MSDIDDRLSETAEEEWDHLTEKAKERIMLQLEILIAEGDTKE